MSVHWSRSTRYFALIAVVAALAALVWFARDLISPLVIAALLAYVLTGVVDFLTSRTRLTRRAAVPLVYWGALGILLGIPAIVTPVLLSESKDLASDLQIIVAQMERLFARPFILFGAVIRPERIFSDLTIFSTDALSPLAGSALAVLETATRNVAWVLVILVATYYLLADGERVREWLIHLAPEAYQPDLRRLHRDIAQVWRSYLRGQISLMFVVGVIFSVVWAAVGLPGALLIGILTGLFSLVPELGPTVAGMLAILVALFVGSRFLPLSKFWFAALVTALYLVLINFKNIWLRPRLIGRSVRLNEGLVFVAILAAIVFWGILGGLIVIPVIASAIVAGRYLHRRILGLPPFEEELEEETTEARRARPVRAFLKAFSRTDEPGRGETGGPS